MLKYVNSSVVFQEIPDEVTLAINISNCPCHCPGCHSKYLWEDIGLPLTTGAIDDFDLILAGEDVKQGKPSPEIYATVISRMGVTAMETIIFEDSNVGLQAAQASGAHFIKVTL